nr:uncharacterized protein LOC111419633 [Onthophagus taurus]
MQMRSFKKMAREKKIKVLTLVIFLCLFGWFRKVKASDVPKLKHFIRDGNNGLEGVCIASESDVYSATDWSFPLTGRQEDQPLTENYFLPNLTSDIDCDFEQGHHCINKYKSNIWRISEENDKKYRTIFDYRWEDLPTYIIDKTTPLTDKRIDIHQNVSITISIRSNDGLKILLCEGWLPNKYACYKVIFGMINGSDVFVVNSKNETITSYSYEKPIFSFDQWRSFQISFLPTGGIILKDLNDDVEIINILDKNPLKVIFLFMESENVSLWKIHQNNFLYTNLTTNTTFGPPVKTTSKNLTICMLVSMCENCKLNFYSKDEKTINLLPKSEIILKNWKLFKIYVTNYTKDQLQLFTETTGPKNGFWMIDNIRICSEKELKLKVLKNNKGILNMSDNEISCHALSKQQWRPKPYLLKLEDVELPSPINFSENTTSIRLSNLNWKPQRIGDEQLPFILKYQGHHLCPENNNLKNVSIERIKSNGILLVEGNEITINKLIPYTHYSFSIIHLIYANLTKEYKLNTKELASITENELPTNVKIIPNTYKAKILRKPASCHDIFGRLQYKYSIGNKTILSISENQDYTSLNSFTNYTLEIKTSRSFNEYFNKVSTFYNFTTKPDVASFVSYLDAYEITEKSVALRYKLPKLVNGVPEKVMVHFCTSLLRNKCDSIIENITKCAQYPDMYCVNVKKLISGQIHTFKLSIKNKGINVFGKEEKIQNVLLKANVPGKISNLTYNVINCSEILEYCNLNISWTHPWNQLGAITAFEIVLTEVNENKGLNEIYTITGEYSPTYYHIINYLPYATVYIISVRAINNKLKGDYVSIKGKIDHIGDHIDQIPSTVNIKEDSISIQIPPLDLRIEKAILVVIVQNDVLQHIDDGLWHIANGSLCKDVAETWIAKVVEFSHENQSFVIGDESSEFSDDYQREIENKKLLPDNEYCFTYVIHNVYKNISHTKIYHKSERTLPAVLEIKESPNVVQTIMIALTVLILFMLIGFVLFRYRYRLKCNRHLQDGEHVYEGIPFDNYSEANDAVYNSTYDKLIHN